MTEILEEMELLRLSAWTFVILKAIDKFLSIEIWLTDAPSSHSQYFIIKPLKFNKTQRKWYLSIILIYVSLFQAAG